MENQDDDKTRVLRLLAATDPADQDKQQGPALDFSDEEAARFLAKYVKDRAQEMKAEIAVLGASLRLACSLVRPKVDRQAVKATCQANEALYELVRASVEAYVVP